jgi:hypothetical protein
MDDANSKSLRDRLDALLRRAREISAEIERRVDEVTAEAPGGPEVESARPHPEVAQDALSVAAEAVAVTAEAAALTAEALSTMAGENTGGGPPVPEAPSQAPTTVIPEAALAVAADAKDPARTDESAAKDATPAAPSSPAAAPPTGTPDESDR